MSPQVRLERHDHVAVLVLDTAPEGVMRGEHVAQLQAALDALEAAPLPRVLTLVGSVPGTFVRRYDVDELLSERRAARTSELSPLQALILRLEALPCITVAALHGSALGGGFELALGCDFRLCADGPFRFGLRETDVGLVPGAGGTQRLSRLLGVARALELVLLGRLLRPQEMLALGLAHAVLPRDSFEQGARAFCQDLALRAPIAMALAKRAIREGAELPLRDALLVEQAAFEESARSHDARAAVEAYAQGRRHTFTGK